MNCKPGDLAVIVDSHKNNPDSAGAICEVVCSVSFGDVTLPNGTPSYYSRTEPGWVIKLHSKVMVKWWDGVMRRAEYACCPDSKLRPIRDNPGQDETLTWLDVPSTDKVTA